MNCPKCSIEFRVYVDGPCTENCRYCGFPLASEDHDYVGINIEPTARL